MRYKLCFSFSNLLGQVICVCNPAVTKVLVGLKNENGCKSLLTQSKNHHHHRCLGHYPHHHLVNGNIGPVDVHQRVSIRTILFVADPKVVQHLVDYNALSTMVMVRVMVIQWENRRKRLTPSLGLT